MKKLICLSFISLVCNMAFSQSYDIELKKLNEYLEKFDNGYYGHFEVKDKVVYLNFKFGKFNRYNIDDIDYAEIQEQYTRVILPCKNNKKCIYSDWKVGGSYEEYTQFLQDYKPFNYQELKDLLDNFIDAVKGKKSKPTPSPLQVKNEKDNNTNVVTVQNWQKALDELNKYIQPNFGETYEVKDKKLINNMKRGYAEANIADLYKIIKSVKYRYVYLKCKEGQNCVYSSVTNWHHDGFSFECKSEAQMDKTFQLFSDFLYALTGIETKTKFTNSQLLTLQNIDKSEVTLLEVPKSEPAYKSLKKHRGEKGFAVYMYLNNDEETFSGVIGFGNNTYKVNKIKISIDDLLSGAAKKLKDEEKAAAAKEDNRGFIDLGIENFKKGDRIKIKEIYTGDSHYRVGKKSEYEGETGTVIEVGYDEINFSYYGTVLMDIDKKEVKFENMEPELITAGQMTNKDTKAGNNEDEDWDSLEKTAGSLNKSVKEAEQTTGTIAWILYDKEITLIEIDKSDPSYSKAKKYIGKKGKTKTYLIPNKDNMTFRGDIYFGETFYSFQKIKVKTN